MMLWLVPKAAIGRNLFDHLVGERRLKGD